MNILFLGGDKRYKYMMKDLSSDNSVSQVGFDFAVSNIKKENLENLNLSNYDIVLLPISGINENLEIKTEEGILILDESLFNNLNQKTIFFTGLKTKRIMDLIPEDQLISFLDDEDVEKKNNDLTVDGTIDDIRDRKNDSICILGYGKLGKELYLRLTHAGIKTYVISRPKELIYKDKVQNYYPLNSENIIEVFKVCDIAINTIPHNIIPEEAIWEDPVPYILDIASFPYGIDKKLIEKYKDKVKYHLYLGIPSKFAPKEASEILLKTLKKVVDNK